MYANLRVQVAKKSARRRPGGEYIADEVLFAWRVRSSAGNLLVDVDQQDGSGSYPEPAGIRKFPLAGYHVEVTTSF
jgi:hypothetical protein